MQLIACFIFIACGYQSIRLIHEISTKPEMAFLPIIAMAGIILILGYGLPSGYLNLMSKNVFNVWKSKLCKKSAQYKRAVAMIPLRVQFGTNFIEIFTPFVMINFCLNSIAGFLLLKQ